MTRFILDFYRRWGLVVALAMVLQLIQGWWITADSKTPIEFTASMIPICFGLIPLFDLPRGVIRVAGTLPLKLAKIGRGWWLAYVLIPAIVLAALLFLGAGLAELWHRNQAFPLQRLAKASLVTVLWLGTLFALIFPARFLATGKPGNRWRSVLTIFASAILSVLFVLWAVFGVVLSEGATSDPTKFAIFLAGGTCLTFMGWLRAGQFDPTGSQFGRPNSELAAKFHAIKAGAASSRPTPISVAPQQPQPGYGGILFLLRITFIDRLIVCLSSGIGILMFSWCASRFAGLVRLPLHDQAMLKINLQEGFKINDPAITVLLIFVLFPLRSSLTQLRLLRTMPISTGKLAAGILASVIAPAIAVGLLMSGIAFSVGTPLTGMILKSCLLSLAPIALCVFFNVWRGGGMQAYILFMLAMMGWVIGISAWQTITFPVAGGIAVGSVLLAWLLTYYALLRSSRAYRVQANALGSFPWIAGN